MEYPNAILFSGTTTANSTFTAIGDAEGLNGVSDTINLIVKNNDSTNALSGFKLQVQTVNGGDWIDWATDTGAVAWTTQDNNMLLATVNPTTLAAGVSALIQLRCGPIHGLKALAKSASAVLVTVSGTIN